MVVFAKATHPYGSHPPQRCSRGHCCTGLAAEEARTLTVLRDMRVYTPSYLAIYARDTIASTYIDIPR